MRNIHYLGINKKQVLPINIGHLVYISNNKDNGIK